MVEGRRRAEGSRGGLGSGWGDEGIPGWGRRPEGDEFKEGDCTWVGRVVSVGKANVFEVGVPFNLFFLYI